MGLNVGSVYSANYSKPAIDVQALAKVTEQILNPNNEKTVDVSKLNLSKFNRVSLGTDLYSANTRSDVALKAAKAATDFGVNFSQAFSANVQYLNSQAAQSLFTSKENSGKVVINLENTEKVNESEVITAAVQVSQSKDLDKDKRGSNPFSFYMSAQNAEQEDENKPVSGSINLVA